jgi:hypothetical protein
VSGSGTTTSAIASSSEMGDPSGGDTVSEGDEESEGPVDDPESCREILLDDAAALSGLYEIAPAGATLRTPILVHCDMDTDGGGWTLVARSVDGRFDPEQFGWTSARGDIEDPTQPYSLDVESAALEFTQVLVGKTGIGYAWGDRVYRFDVADGFLALVDASVETMGLTTLVGDCDDPGMLQYAGYTGDMQVFWFRDESGFERFGLLHDGFDMYGPNSDLFPCGHGGNLHDEQGLIMVR